MTSGSLISKHYIVVGCDCDEIFTKNKYLCAVMSAKGSETSDSDRSGPKRDASDCAFFRKAYEENYGRLVFYVNSYCHDIEAARNIVQDVFVSFWENLGTFDRGRNPLPYLVTISKNKTLNYLKRNALKNKIDDAAGRSAYEVNVITLTDSNLGKVFERDAARIIEESLGAMKGKMRETFILSRNANLTNAEIAARLGVSEKTVEYRFMVALRILRKRLKDYLK